MQAPGKTHPWRTRAHKHNWSPSVQHGWQIVLAIGPTGGTPSQRRPLSGIYVGLDMCQISGAVRTMRWKRRRSVFFFFLMARTASTTWPRRLSLACVTVSLSHCAITRLRCN